MWQTRGAFLEDPAVYLVGYQSFLPQLVEGLFLFNHRNCETTLSLRVEQFADLYDGPIYAQRLTGTERCRGYCQNSKSLERCPNECECAFVREILQIISGWPKAPG